MTLQTERLLVIVPRASVRVSPLSSVYVDAEQAVTRQLYEGDAVEVLRDVHLKDPYRRIVWRRLAGAEEQWIAEKTYDQYPCIEFFRSEEAVYEQ